MNPMLSPDPLIEELTELCLTGKDWLSQLEFVGTNLGILRTFFGPVAAGLAEKRQYDVLSDVLIAFTQIQHRQSELRHAVQVYEKQLEGHIVALDRSIGLDMLENNILLAADLQATMSDYLLLRERIINLYKSL